MLMQCVCDILYRHTECNHVWPDLIELQNGLNALVQEMRLLEQAAAVQGHQLLVKVHSKDIKMETSLHVFSLP